MTKEDHRMLSSLINASLTHEHKIDSQFFIHNLMMELDKDEDFDFNEFMVDCFKNTGLKHIIQVIDDGEDE